MLHNPRHITTFTLISLTAIFCLINIRCRNYLEAKPDKTLVIPQTLKDAQRLLDAYSTLNQSPSIAIESDDDHYVPDQYFNGLQINLRQNYIWDKDAYLNDVNSWLWIYPGILQANLALETVNGITPDNTGSLNMWKQVKGTALFFRGYKLYFAAQFWAPPYKKELLDKKLGVPLRLTSDVNEEITRSTVKETYNQIIKDFKKAIALLPVSVSPKSRPSKAAGYGALSRVYLAMNDYKKAGIYADSALQFNHSLLDFNHLDIKAPIPIFNAEVIFQSISAGTRSTYAPRGVIDSTLYRSYNTNDLRKQLYFSENEDGSLSYNASYTRSPYTFFNGIATDELLLTRAECYARNDKIHKAMADLNTLIKSRWKAGTFRPLTANSKEEALNIILTERRKELTGRGLRWFDLRRLNQEPEYAITLYRKINGKTYALPPNDPRYTFYIPTEVIEKSQMRQNIR